VIFRKSEKTTTSEQIEAYDRKGGRRRREREDADPYAHLTGGGPADRERPPRQPDHPGPYDASEIDLSGPGPQRIDLGGLVIAPLQGMELRLQIDEATQTVVAALLVMGESALELRAFAAPRTGGLWDELRKEISSETTRRGGVVTENRGPYGTELKVIVPVRAPDGSQVSQVSRIMGIDGPRWFLRGTLVGRAAGEPQVAAPLLQALAQVVVVRGKAPMAPRDMIPLHIPEQGA
jgi:Protein of unknown function (DUF3710)